MMALVDWKDIGILSIALVGGLSAILCMNTVIAWLMKPMQPLLAKVPVWIWFSTLMVVYFSIGGWCIRDGVLKYARHDYKWISGLGVGTIFIVVSFALVIAAIRRHKGAMKEGK